MSLYGSNGAANTNVPKHTIVAKIPQSNNGAIFVNTTPSAFVNNMVVGIYGVSKNLVATSVSKGRRDTAPGWILRRSGMGPVVSINVTAGGSGYSNNDLAKVTANACLNTTANVVTNSTGGITGFTNLTNGGGRFPNTAYVTLAISNTTGGTPNGTSFTGTVTLGGRAGRHHNEVLVAVTSMGANSTINTAAFPNA